MIIQTIDNVLYNVSIYDHDYDVDCAVDVLQVFRPLTLNETETAYKWWGDSSSLHEALDYWKGKGYAVEIEVIGWGKIKNAINTAVYYSNIDYQLELVLNCLWGIAMDDKEIEDIISEVESLRSRLNYRGQKVLEILEKEFDHAN